MAGREFQLRDGRRGAALAIRVTPRARKNEISGILEDGTVRIRLAAPPLEGKANQALIRFLAEVLEVPAASLEIVAGATSRNKLVSVLDLDAGEVQARLKRRLG